MLHNAKKNYFTSKLNTSLPSKEIWRNIREIGIGNKTKDDAELDPNELNEYFLSDTAQTPSIDTNMITQIDTRPKFTLWWYLVLRLCKA